MTKEFNFHLSIKGPDRSWEFSVPLGQTTIGRQIGSGLLLNHNQVSRQHAQLDCTATECHITDLDSSNGTRYNGEKLTPNVQRLLTTNDIIKIGPFTLEVDQVPVEVVPKDQQPPKRKSSQKPKTEEMNLDNAQLPLQSAAPPPPPPPQTPQPPFRLPLQPDDENLVSLGLGIKSTRLLKYLPDIYRTEFMSRFLAIFEAILTPIEWNSDNFDLFLAPGTAPFDFLSWLANWYELSFNATWSEDQRRQILADAHKLFARRGTRWALERLLEIYLGCTPVIIDESEDLEPFTFRVKIPSTHREVKSELIEALIDTNKPAHTMYDIEFVKE